MLSLGKIAAGPGAASYYTDQVALGREDYYAGEGEAPGRWIGGAAEAAGLSGQVEAGAFADLLAGGGLRKPVREGAVAGFDMTFRAPKSVSVLWGIADPETTRQLGEAHDAAVEAALGYMERKACWARRGAGGVVQVRGAGFVAAAFRHRASRAGDPLLHTHVVAGNLTLGPDERWTALDARHLYRHAKTAGFLYQAELRREVVERLGLEWGPVERGTADIEGVPPGVVEHFSQRRAELLARMAEHGGRSAASAQVAALETRRAKQNINADRLREDWRSRAAEHGLTGPELERVLSPGDRWVGDAVGVGPEALTESASVFGRAELLQKLAEAQPRGATIGELERMADGMLREPAVVVLPHGPVPAGLSERRFTTRDLLEVEQDLLTAADRRRAGELADVDERTVERALAGRSLSAEQAAVVEDICCSGDGISVVRAAAGTGKTFVLDAAREAWQAQGTQVIGCALSARAALELSDQAGIPSVTIAELKRRLDEGRELPPNSVLVVDEAGMVGTRDLARLTHATGMSLSKLVLVGDDRQLPEIQAGGAFHALAERLPSNELREVRRQEHAWDRQALDALRSGEVEQWARAYREHGHITVAPTASATRTALVNDWAQADGDRLMIAARRDDVADLNHHARRHLQEQGQLGPDELVAAGRGYSAGDRVIGCRNDRALGILNGQRGTITAADPETRRLDVVLDDGRQVHLGPEYLDAGHLDHGYAITAHRAQGATVDRTFVLGSEELYREWGYTALSRHRHQARFYVSGADLHTNPELPVPHDPLIAGITSLLERTQAKGLAIDELPAAGREQLERERDELRETLAAARAPQRIPVAERREIEQLEQAAGGARDRHERLTEQRSQLGWRRRHERDGIDEQLERNAERKADLDRRLEVARTTILEAEEADRRWLDLHGPAAHTLLTVDEELHTRDTTRAVVEHHLDAHHRDPLPKADLSLDQDLGLDLGM